MFNLSPFSDLLMFELAVFTLPPCCIHKFRIKNVYSINYHQGITPHGNFPSVFNLETIVRCHIKTCFVFKSSVFPPKWLSFWYVKSVLCVSLYGGSLLSCSGAKQRGHFVLKILIFETVDSVSHHLHQRPISKGSPEG